MTRTIEVTVDQEGRVTDAQPVETGDVTPQEGPTPREARRQNLKAARADEIRARRTAIIKAAVDRRRKVREAERTTAIARAREEAGEAKDVIENGEVVASRVIVPPEYQRPYTEGRAVGYAMRFSWRKFRSIAINRRPDGTLALVDGQHRLRAAQMVFGPDVVVPCTFTHVETTAEEAGDFDGINTDRSGLAYNAAFRARVHYEDPDSVLVMTVLAEKGLRPLWPREPRGIKGTVTACRTIEYMTKKAGVTSARATISILHELWGDDPEGYRDFMLGGLWQFLLRYDGHVRRDRIIEVLREASRKDGPKAMDDLTADHRSSVNTSSAAAFCGAVHYLYNYRLRPGSALPPYAPESTTRHNAVVRRHARRWLDTHERSRQARRGPDRGAWVDGTQVPFKGRPRDKSPNFS
jgi:hypothetical protein